MDGLAWGPVGCGEQKLFFTQARDSQPTSDFSHRMASSESDAIIHPDIALSDILLVWHIRKSG